MANGLKMTASSTPEEQRAEAAVKRGETAQEGFSDMFGSVKNFFTATIGDIVPELREKAEEQERLEEAKRKIAKRDADRQAGVPEHQNVDPEETQATFDDNPVNQEEQASPFEKANEDLFAALRDDSDLDAIRTALEEDKQDELVANKRMEQSLKDLKARKVGMDLTPLAALIDDPNKAAVLARTLSPAFSEEEKQEQILGMEFKLQDRKDKFRKSRNRLRLQLAKSENNKSIALAQATVQAAHAKELRAAKNEEKRVRELDKLAQRQTKAMTDSRNRFLSKSRVGDDISNIKGMMSTLDKMGPGGSNLDNPLAQSLIRFDLIRAVQPGGVITDKDLEAVSRQADIRNRLKASVQKMVDGDHFTDTDKRNIATVLALTVKGTKRRIKDQADAEANALEKSFVTRDGMGQFRASDLTSPGNIYHIDQYVPPETESRIYDLVNVTSRSAAGEDVDKSGAARSEKKQRILQRIKELEGGG